MKLKCCDRSTWGPVALSFLLHLPTEAATEAKGADPFLAALLKPEGENEVKDHQEHALPQDWILSTWHRQ